MFVRDLAARFWETPTLVMLVAAAAVPARDVSPAASPGDAAEPEPASMGGAGSVEVALV